MTLHVYRFCARVNDGQVHEGLETGICAVLFFCLAHYGLAGLPGIWETGTVGTSRAKGEEHDRASD